MSAIAKLFISTAFETIKELRGIPSDETLTNYVYF